MKRKIIEINEELCNGCGACADACHEGAIIIENSKAKLIRDDYCDGLGDCLPACPTNAIKIIERKANEYNQEAVKANQKPLPCGCSGSMAKEIKRINDESKEEFLPKNLKSRLSSWPVQIKLAPVTAPYFDGAKLLIAADCTAYAYANFHEDFIKDRITLIGCPKLDDIDYSKKLCEIIKANEIKDVTIIKMEVPCCAGLEHVAKTALQESGKFIPWSVITISTDGRIL